MSLTGTGGIAGLLELALGHGWLALLRHSGRPLLCKFGKGAAYSLHKGPPGMVHGKWAVKHKLSEMGMA